MFLSPFALSPSAELAAAEAIAREAGEAYLSARSALGPFGAGVAELREAFRAASAQADALRSR